MTPGALRRSRRRRARRPQIPRRRPSRRAHRPASRAPSASSAARMPRAARDRVDRARVVWCDRRAKIDVGRRGVREGHVRSEMGGAADACPRRSPRITRSASAIAPADGKRSSGAFAIARRIAASIGAGCTAGAKLDGGGGVRPQCAKRSACALPRSSSNGPRPAMSS